MTPVERLIYDAITRTVEMKGVAYFGRPTGSYILDGNDKKLSAASYLTYLRGSVPCATEITDEVEATGCRFGPCRYFSLPIDGSLRGYEAACQVKDLPQAELREVRLTAKMHEVTEVDGVILGGYELVAPGIQPTPTDYSVIIIGPHEGDVFVYTWHPGRVMPTGQVELPRMPVKLAGVVDGH
jgi:hypothetical protein